MPEIIDDYKKISSWCFKVKDYKIIVELNSSWVIFMVFGDKKLFKKSTYPISWIKYQREYKKKKELLITELEFPEKRSNMKCKNCKNC